MGYLHIKNLYADQRILAFKECYALEKIHGTSAHIAWIDGTVRLSSGGEPPARFAALFDVEKLAAAFREIGHPKVTVYGEAYGGKQQAQAWRYGPQLRFVAFDVKVDDRWLRVPDAEQLVTRLGLEFVAYVVVPADVAALDAQRDAPSDQARRNGVAGDQPREGVVLRPLAEYTDEYGERIIAKHKRDEERETATPRRVVDPAQQQVLTAAAAIATEWVTPTRLDHVLDKLPPGRGIEHMRDVIAAMVEDVEREAGTEIVPSREARAEIGKATAKLFKAKLQSKLA